MNSKKKNTANEPSPVYETTAKERVDELDPILVQLIEKSKKEFEQGKGISTEEVIRQTKLRYPFLK